MVAQKLQDVEVQVYPYRTASVGDCFLQLPRELMRDFERSLALTAGVSPDNHTVYNVSFDRGDEKQATYIKFTDGWVIFGRKVLMVR